MTLRPWRRGLSVGLSVACTTLLACGAGSGSRTPGTAAERGVLHCPAGPVLILRQADVEALRGCQVLHSLSVRSAAELDLEALSRLREIAGDLVVGPTITLNALSLPALQNIGGRLRLSGNGTLSSVVLAQLTRASTIELVSNPSLVALSVPRLANTTLAGMANGSLELVLIQRAPTIDLDGSPNLRVELSSGN